MSSAKLDNKQSDNLKVGTRFKLKDTEDDIYRFIGYNTMGDSCIFVPEKVYYWCLEDKSGYYDIVNCSEIILLKDNEY